MFGLIPYVKTTLRVLNIVDDASKMHIAIQNLIVRRWDRWRTMTGILRQVGEFQTMSDKLTDAKEQLRMASPAEREQDLTQQQPPTESPPQKQHVPPQSSSQPVKQQSRKDPRQQLFHPEPGPQMKQDAPRQQPVHERQESRPNQEPQQPREKHRVRIQEDSPTVDDGRGKRPRVVDTGSQKMETDQVPESELPPVPEDDDLNATVIEVMTDVEVLLDGSSVIDVFAVNSARRKRVEVSERKLTESDRKLFRKAKELELQSWLDHRVFDLVKKKFVDQESHACEMGLDMEVDWKGKSTSVCVGLSGSRSDRGAP